jgi:hypothetical protein
LKDPVERFTQWAYDQLDAGLHREHAEQPVIRKSERSELCSGAMTSYHAESRVTDRTRLDALTRERRNIDELMMTFADDNTTIG